MDSADGISLGEILRGPFLHTGGDPNSPKACTPSSHRHCGVGVILAPMAPGGYPFGRQSLLRELNCRSDSNLECPGALPNLDSVLNRWYLVQRVFARFLRALAHFWA